MIERKVTRRSMLLSAGAAVASYYPGLGAKAAVDTKQFQNLDHNKYMRHAIELAKKVPDCPFGAVIVNIKTGKVESEGWVEVDKSPLWHGEMSAIRNCPDSNTGFNWQEMCLYTTGESCPMCQSAIIWTKMPLVVYGSSMPVLQKYGFGQINIRAQKVIDASLYGKPAIIGDVLASECEELFKQAQKLNQDKEKQ